MLPASQITVICPGYRNVYDAFHNVKRLLPILISYWCLPCFCDYFLRACSSYHKTFFLVLGMTLSLLVCLVQLLSCVWLFATPWTTAHQASLSITNSQSSPKPMSIESVMPSNHHAPESEVAQSCPTLCYSMDGSLPGFSVHGIFQARVLEWVAFSFSRGSSGPRDRTQVSSVVGRRFTVWAT